VAQRIGQVIKVTLNSLSPRMWQVDPLKFSPRMWLIGSKNGNGPFKVTLNSLSPRMWQVYPLKYSPRMWLKLH